MAVTIPNLWPEEFKIDVQSPYAILRVQAELLGKVTKGILIGEVETESNDTDVQHRLVVIAPAYNNFRYTLLAAKHAINFPYPTEVISQSLAIPVDYELEKYPIAYSDDVLTDLVRRALSSGDTKAVILSLIAKSNEAGLSSHPYRLGEPARPDGVSQEGPPPEPESRPDKE